MADHDDAPPPAVEPPLAEARSRRLSAVWLMPLLALVIALGLAWQTWDSRGPLIEIVFDDASGLVAGQTPVRFRDVTVGVVEKIELSSDLTRVIVRARINKDVAHFIDDKAQFWIVRASITPQGVSGLDTVVSGAYIGASWDNQPDDASYSFQGLARPPLTPEGTPGLRVRLRAPDGGSMTVGAPVLFKRIQVGKIEDIQLTDAGDVMLDIFVNAPNDARLTEATRFWNASGFSIQLGSGGAALNVDSLISLVQGGIAFDTIGSDLTRVGEDHMFQLYNSETAARQNLIEDVPGNSLVLDVDFDQSVRGLAPGAQVQFQGIPVGEVTGVQGVSEVVDGRLVLRQRATITIVPERFGQPPAPEGSEARTVALDYIEARVKEGLRAQLASQGLLSQTLYVSLVELPGAPPATFDRDAQPNPLLPSAPSTTDSVTDSAAGFMDRIASLPIEEVVQNVVALLANVNAIVSDPKVRSAPENLGALIADLHDTLNQSGIQQAPQQIAEILASVKAVVDQATQAQLIANLSDVLATTKTAVASIGTAADGVPALLAQVDALSGKVSSLPLDQLVGSATQLVDGLDAFVRSDDVAGLPASVTAALADLRGVVDDLKAGGAVTNLNASLASLREVSDQIAAAKVADSLARVLAEAEQTVNTVGTAASGLPKLVELARGPERERPRPAARRAGEARRRAARHRRQPAGERWRAGHARPARRLARRAARPARGASGWRRGRQPQRHPRLRAPADRPARPGPHRRQPADGHRPGEGRVRQRDDRDGRPARARRLAAGGRRPDPGAAARSARRLARRHARLRRCPAPKRGHHQPAAEARRRRRGPARHPRRGAARRHGGQAQRDARLHRPRGGRARRQPAGARRPLHRCRRPRRRRARHRDAGLRDQPADDPAPAGVARRRTLRQPACDDAAAPSQLHHLREMTMAARPRPVLAALIACACLPLAGCGTETAYLLPQAPAAKQVPSPVRGIALADVSLPAYASDVGIAALVGPETIELEQVRALGRRSDPRGDAAPRRCARGAPGHPRRH
ncbi:MAG: MlaD family protein [Amaricoccus sp.]|uniref:MlaD family protein n=1 Tax=Amaricoccus sp. TaxID=1872485 RepID=UPI0039E65F7C